MRGAAPLLVATMLLAACGGGGGGGRGIEPPTSSVAPGSLTYTGPSSLAITWASNYVKEAQYVGPVTKDVLISMNVAVAPQNAAGLVQYAKAANTPGNPNYRHFLTPQQIGQEFGASLSNYQAATKYFQNYGISVGGWPQRLTLAVTGTTSSFGKAFGTTFGWYKLGKQTFVAPVSAPHLTQAEPIVAVAGLSQYNAAHTYIIRPSNAQWAGYSPQQIAHGFDFTGPYSNNINGSGITVGIIGTGPIDTASNGDGAALSATYNVKLAPIAVATVQPQNPNATNENTGDAFDVNPGGLASPPPVTAPCPTAAPPAGYSFSIPDLQTCNPEDGEAQLDTQSVASLAPGSTVSFYLAYNGGVCVNSSGDLYAATSGTCNSGDYIYEEEGIDLADDEIQQAIADNTADALSLSYGEGEVDAAAYGYFSSSNPTQGPGPLEFAALAAEGIAVFVSSGDTGNESCDDPSTYAPLTTPCVSYPASDPSVAGVGGVNIPLDNAGNLEGVIAAWADQTTAGGDGSFENNIGSGGGLSEYFSELPAQTSANLSVASNPSPASSALNGMRPVPDIAMDADPQTGPAIAIDAAPGFGGGIFPIGGTSAAAPEMAAAWALVLQACKASSSCATASGTHPYRLGDPTTAIYAVYGGKGTLPYSQSIYDVLYGENQANLPSGSSPASVTGCCTAGAGYDMVTGVGVPMIGHFIQSIVGTTEP